MPNLGPNYDLAVRLRNLENLVGQLARNQVGQAFSATQSDGSIGMQIQQRTDGAASTATTWYQGAGTPRDPQTGLHPPLLYVGETFVNGKSQNSSILISRPDGSLACQLGGQIGQRFYDTKGNIVWNSDETSGEGLADPWVPLPNPAPTAISSWPSTTATTPGLVAQSVGYAQHPKLFWNATVLGDAGVTGSAYLQLVQGGTTITGPTHTFAAGQTVYISDVLTLAQPFWMQSITCNVFAQVTGGTGKTYVQTFGLYGRQT